MVSPDPPAQGIERVPSLAIQRLSARLRLVVPLMPLRVRSSRRAASKAADAPLSVVASTTIATELARTIGGAAVSAQAIMGPDVDPHRYRFTAGDLEAAASAGLVVVHGLGLEGDGATLRQAMDAAGLDVVDLGSLLPQDVIRSTGDGPAATDPHVWLDPTVWAQTASAFAALLAGAAPAAAADIGANLDSYLQAMASLDAELESTLGALVAAQRTLVTAHAAFGYFGARYGFHTVSVLGSNSDVDLTAAAVSEAADALVASGTHVAFVESSVPYAGIEALIAAAQERGYRLQLGGELKSDALGAAGTTTEGYIGMMRANMFTILGALTEPPPTTPGTPTPGTATGGIGRRAVRRSTRTG